jgi:S-adenosylmethionine-diacylglycerol 3-amino-3-carboxypropyl transferase
MNTETINYSQCWEDPKILLEALDINPNDEVLSVTSGGDNILALLIALPQHIVSVDMNTAQSYLLELKMAAAQSLSYNEYLEFLGVNESNARLDLYKKVSLRLSNSAREWWAVHESYIKAGPINCGRFEKFTALFAKRILPMIHNHKTIKQLLSFDNIEEQRVFFQTRWNSSRWRFFLRLFTSRFILKRFARQRGMFSHANIQNVACVYEKRMERHLNSVPNKGNFFIHYSLTGRYGDSLPPYLEQNGYTKLRTVQHPSFSIITANLLSYLRSMPDNSFSKFNLSDIFEALSEIENDTLWYEIIRTAKSGAKVAYWNNLVKRSYPASLSSHISTDDKFVKELRSKDKVFFYDSFHMHTIKK